MAIDSHQASKDIVRDVLTAKVVISSHYQPPFHAEHHNMRTYYFAAEAKKEMQDWMNAMSLASILQNDGSVRNHDEVNVKRVGAEQTSIGSLMGNDDEDSGFTSYHSRRPLSPLQQDVNSTLTDSCTSNELYRSGRTAEDSMHDSISESSYPDGYLGSADKYPNPTYGGSGHHLPPPVHHSPNVFQQTMSPGQPVSKQHLYANAPPKPKRMGGPGDIYALGIHDGETVSSRPAPGQGQHYSDYKERDKVTSQMSQHVASRGHRDSSPMPRLRVDEYQGPVSSQRRTPDPYARTAVNQGFEYQAPPVVGRHERNSNYTDEYAATIAAVAGQMHLQGGRDEYGSLQRQVVDFPHRSQKGSLQAAVAQRPHSAEFLDYNVYGDGSHQRRQRNPSEMVTQGRPRSTMIERYGPTDFDVNGINEMEMYASVHGRWPPPQVGGGKKTQRVQEITNERRSGSISTPCEGPATPRSNTSHNMSFDSYLTRDAVYGDVRDAQVQQSHLEPRPHSRPMPGQVERLSASPSSSVTGLDSITRNMNATNVVSPLARGEPSRTLPRDRSFMRSASARLPSATSMTSVNQLQVNGTGTKEDSRWKAQQREESMKRLLEWKQRMLQSPLTKKYQKSPGIPVQHQQSKTVPSSVTTSPVILPNSQNQDQHSPSSGTQQQSSGVHQPEDKMSSSRLSSSQHYQPQMVQELENGHEGTLRGHSPAPGRPIGTPERLDRGVPAWRDQDLSHGVESLDSNFTRVEPRGTKGVRTSSRSPNRTQEQRRTSSSLNRYYNSYSSDDEEMSLQEFRRARLEAQANRARKSNADRHSGNRRLGSNPDVSNDTSVTAGKKHKPPDYVNIAALQEAKDIASVAVVSSTAMTLESTHAAPTEGHEYVNLPFPNDTVKNSRQYKWDGPENCNFSSSPSCLRRRHCSEPNRLHREGNHSYDDDDGGDGDMDEDDFYPVQTRVSDKYVEVKATSMRKYFQDEATQTYDSNVTYRVANAVAGSSVPPLCSNSSSSLQTATSGHWEERALSGQTSNDTKNSKDFGGAAGNLTGNMEDILSDGHSVEEVRNKDRFFHGSYVDQYYREFRNRTSSLSRKTWESYSDILAVQPSTLHDNKNASLGLPPWPQNGSHGLENVDVGEVANQTLVNDEFTTTVEPPEPFRSDNVSRNSDTTEAVFGSGTRWSPSRDVETKPQNASSFCGVIGSDQHVKSSVDAEKEIICVADQPSSCSLATTVESVANNNHHQSESRSTLTAECSQVSDHDMIGADMSDYQKQKESPPKNIVQDRIRIFESQADSALGSQHSSPVGKKGTTDSIGSAVSSKSSSPSGGLFVPVLTESSPYLGDLPDSKGPKNTVDSQTTVSSCCSDTKLLPLRPFRRRFHSDTETLMYESSTPSSCSDSSVDEGDPDSVSATTRRKKTTRIGHEEQQHLSNLKAGVIRLPSSTKEQTPNDGREYEKKDVGSETISRKFSVLEKDAEHFMDDIDGKTKDDRSLGNGGVSPSNVSGYFENALTQKNGTEAEEYYLPMNGCGTGILGSSSVLDGSTLERFSTVPPSSKFWHFEATGSNVSLEAEEAVYVQMDGYSAFGIQTSNQTKLSSLSMISPIEDSYSDPQEGQTDGPNANLDRGCTKDIDRGEVEGSGRKTSSTSSDMDEGSVPKGNSTVNTTNSLENYGYYEIPDSSLFTKHPTLTDDPMSSHYEPIYAEPKQITGVATGQLAPPLPDRFFDTCVDERHQTSLLVSRQRNASPITSLSSKVPELPSRDCLAARTSGVDVAEMATNHHKPHSSKTYKWTTGSIHRRKRDVDLSATQSSASDADDEASKDFDTHPRFSLSDSFRPASYYLKVSAATLATKDKNRAERSSEEELESPPPIPLSPPPLLFCETDTMDGMISPRPGNDDGQRTKGLSATNVEAVLARTIRPKERVRFDTSSQRKSTDASTVTAPPTSPLHSKLNYSYYRVYEDDRRITEMLFKPVPVESALPSRSAPSSPTSSGPNMVVERASTKDSAISLALPSSLPKMNLQVRRLRIYDEGKSAANSKFKPLSSQSSGSSTSACHEPSDPVISSSSKDYRIPITMLKDAGTQWSPPVSVSSEGDLDNGVVNVQTRATSTPEDGNGSNSESGSGGVRAKRSPLSAPYYYSDLLREDERGFGSSDLGFSSSTSISSDRGLSSRMASGPSPGGSNLHQHQYRYQLNNSRSVGSGGGGGLRRDEIGRKVNNIELAQNRGLRSVQQQGTFNRQGERVNVATELTNSIVYLEAKKLAGAERNTYESDTLKKMTRGLSLDCAGLRASQTQALALAGVDVRNVYPSGIVGEKLAPATSTSSFGHFSSHTQSQNRPQRLSRSLEGLLVDDALLPSANDQGAVLEQSSASRRLWPLQTSTDRVLEKHSNMSTNRMPRQNRSRRMAFDDQSGENLRTARSLEELDEPDEGYLQQHRHHNSRQNHFLAEGQRLEGFRIDHGLLQHWDVPRSGIAAPPSTAHGTLNWEMTGSFDERSVAAPSSSSQTSMTCDTVRTVGNGGWEDSTVHDTSQQQQSHFLGVGPPDSLTLPDDADGGRPSRHPDHHLPFLVLRGRSDFDGGGRDDFKIDSRDILVEGGSRSLQHVPKHHLTEDIKDLDAIVVNESSEEEEETAHQSRLEDCGGTSNATEGCCVAENGTDEGAVDEALESESWTGSIRTQKENRSPLRQQAPGRLSSKRRHRIDTPSATGLKTVREDANVSDSEVHAEMKTQNVKIHKYMNERNEDDHKMKLSISAGDLLGKTHEELILLLIQLRRDQAKLEQAMHKCSVELDAEHKMSQFDTNNRTEHMNRQKQLLKHYEELTKQYELTKPLINLVDNMVKLGSLYGGSEQMLASQYNLEGLPPQDYTPPKKMIEFSRRLQEQRLLQHERANWEHLSPEQVDLQAKLQELYKVGQAFHDESYLVSGLQQDKNMLEKAVESLKGKLDVCGESPMELEKLQKQLRAAEKELSKLRNQLTYSTKKLEETAADNAKIENEIMVLRQKMQASLKQGLGGSGNVNEASHVKVQLEKELSRISNVMEDLAWKREELSGALEQLKDRNKALLADVRASPTGVAGSVALPGRKNHRSTYLETDLDTMETRDILDSWNSGDGSVAHYGIQRGSQVPLYVNTYQHGDEVETGSPNVKITKEDVDSSLEYVQSDQPINDSYKPQDINEADDRMKRFYGILPKEKPAEIKTVRIVKRESERRSKGRDRRKPSFEGDVSLGKGNELGNTAYIDELELTEEMLQFQRSLSLPRNYERSGYLYHEPHVGPNAIGVPVSTLSDSQQSSPNSVSLKDSKNVSYYYRTPSLSNSNPEAPSLSAHERLFGTSSSYGTPSSSPSATSPTLCTPAFKSEAARKIVAETANELATINQSGDGGITSPGKYAAGTLKRRQKRRHYTVSSSQPLILETVTQKMVHARSRDDLDMERCLRSSNTPDVVKSTIKKSEAFDESTIDRELGLPSKIVIPERYVEEEGEELTPAEQLQRLQKAESIRKMLSESTAYGDVPPEEVKSATLKKKLEAERKQREHLLALNQIIAKEVMERSKAVAASLTVVSDHNPQ